MGDIQANGLRKGTTIIHDGLPWRVLEFEHRTPGNKRGFVQTKLRNLLDGTQRTVKFSAGDMLDRAIIETREMDYLYAEGESAGVFMDTENYEQVTVGDDLFREALPWLSEGLRVQIELLEDRPIGVRLPKTVELVVSPTSETDARKWVGEKAIATLHRGAAE